MSVKYYIINSFHPTTNILEYAINIENELSPFDRYETITTMTVWIYRNYINTKSMNQNKISTCLSKLRSCFHKKVTEQKVYIISFSEYINIDVYQRLHTLKETNSNVS
jgi:hypothetical protein